MPNIRILADYGNPCGVTPIKRTCGPKVVKVLEENRDPAGKNEWLVQMNCESHSTDRAGWLDLRRLTEYATVSERTLREWIHAEVDPLPAVRVHGKILVQRRAFDTWLARHAIKPIDLNGIVEEMTEAIRGR